MSKYITVKLTEDQLEALANLVMWHIDWIEQHSSDESQDAYTAFYKRIETKLAKAKNK